ncbi:MAG: rhodanese-like domain-containing protein [Methanobacterium paludis]|nr:rhodanese-like domain-containing protein [Methanobacterium paludis]
MPQFVTITPQEALKLIEERGHEITILDIRPKEDFEKEHVPGALNLDYDGHEFQQKVEKLPWERGLTLLRDLIKK